MTNGSRAEIERYRSAADETLRQLEWCTAYLRRIRKSQIADGIDANRRLIQDRMRQEPERTRRGA